jgi:hypothetical protein
MLLPKREVRTLQRPAVTQRCCHPTAQDVDARLHAHQHESSATENHAMSMRTNKGMHNILGDFQKRSYYVRVGMLK